jgi:transposase
MDERAGAPSGLIAGSSLISLEKLKHFRRLATRCGKLRANFLAMVQLASMSL